MLPGDAVECPVFLARLSAAACVARNRARTASGGGRGFPIYPACSACKLGAIRFTILRSRGWTPRPFRPFNVSRDSAQRAAREQLRRAGGLEDVPTIDAPLAAP